MEITKDKLEQLYKLSDELEVVQNIASEQYKVAKDRFGKNTIEIERESKKITVTENNLWEEVYYLGVNKQAGEIMKGKYPEIFKAFDEQDKKASEYQQFILVNFGVNYKEMKFSDYVKMTDALIKYNSGK